MFQLSLGYTFTTLTGLLALMGFVSVFIHASRRDNQKAGSAFLMFVMCGVLSVLFAWMAGV